MTTLYIPEASASSPALILNDPAQWEGIASGIHREAMSGKWKPLEFDFDPSSGQSIGTPDLCTVYLPGLIAFPSQLRHRLFPKPCASIEFLPIEVRGARWFMLNCLKTTHGYVPDESVFGRLGDGEIFWIEQIVITDTSVLECEVFTIADSTRAQLIFVESIVQRISALALNGLSFRHIGRIEE